MDQIKLAHISDLHFNAASFNPAQIFSKRWLGNLNSVLFRKSQFTYEGLALLKDLFKKQGISHILISGDISTTSHKEEFLTGKAFVEELKKENFEVITLPGNHDHYTKKAYKQKLFYHYFEPSFEQNSPFNLKDHGVAIKSLNQNWHLIVLDTTCLPKFLASQGHFSPHIEKHLEEALTSLKGQNIILANHFPFFQHENLRKRLIRGDEMKKLFAAHPNIKLYLHGHTHRFCVADLRVNGLPIVLDPGSTCHRFKGGCHILEIDSNGCHLGMFKWNEEEWKLFQQHQFNW
ncbi:MAG TPA: metallophosphoesterase [Rhabdochlamydiaceae bacterium]|nr:metallophosphoesterase [Rhabdochlamydiaceae bacterium]